MLYISNYALPLIQPTVAWLATSWYTIFWYTSWLLVYQNITFYKQGRYIIELQCIQRLKKNLGYHIIIHIISGFLWYSSKYNYYCILSLQAINYKPSNEDVKNYNLQITSLLCFAFIKK